MTNSLLTYILDSSKITEQKMKQQGRTSLQEYTAYQVKKDHITRTENKTLINIYNGLTNAPTLQAIG